jgi:predicted dithiol-disulfide oxidoreductase (DUF899 family)
MDQTRLTESPEYTARREELRLAEIELMRHREEVAALRRKLPEGPAVSDYVFREGPRLLKDGDAPVTEVRLSELFTGPDRPLVIYHLMYGKAQEWRATARSWAAQSGVGGVDVELGQDGLGDAVEQRGLARRVPVDDHRVPAQCAGQAAHRQPR